MRIGLWILFIALLVSPLVYKRISAHDASTGNPIGRYGFSFQESSKAAGIDFKHSSPKLDSKLDHIMPQVASMGASVSVVDFDRDGWPDIYVINSGEGSKNALYRNQHDGTFRDVAGEVGLADLNQPGTESRPAPSGETTTTTASTMSSSINGASRNSSTTMLENISRE